MNSKIVELSVAPGITLYHAGPSLDLGPLPSLFYFSLSGPHSLGLDPYNQPVQFLNGKMLRVFSMTLPAHENNLPPTEAIQTWAEEYSRGLDPLGDFLNQCGRAIEFAIQEQFVQPKKLGVAGLSRGGLIAFHLAARDERFRFILGFAPVTKLSDTKEFRQRDIYSPFDAENLESILFDRHIRLYIGNHDTRVSTQSCFEFAQRLSSFAYTKHIRSPKIEYFMTPSIGQHGHGTSPEIFRQGADWISECLLSP